MSVFDDTLSADLLSDAYSRDGKPLETMDEYIAEFTSDRSVARDTIGIDVVVSTVFLVLDHGMGRHGFGGDSYRPVLFETMVFGGDHDQDGIRYSSEEEAREGHAKVVARLTAGEHPFEEGHDA